METAAAERTVLALSSGSSSLKFGLYRVGPTRAEMLLSGEAESIGEKAGLFRALDARGNATVSETAPISSQEDAIARVGALLAASNLPAPSVVGHRLVHGGPKL